MASSHSFDRHTDRNGLRTFASPHVLRPLAEQMTSASKFFAKAVATMTCADLVHADRRSCCEAAVWNFTRTIAGCCRYVLPIAIVRTCETVFCIANDAGLLFFL